MKRFFFNAVMLLILTSCGDDAKITVYRIPKETKPEGAPPAMAATGEAGAGVEWTVPPDWEEQRATGFRKGSYLVRGDDGKQAEVSITSFPETAGGLLANVNRWRDQLKLPPITDAQQAGTTLSGRGHEIFFVDLVSERALPPNEYKSRLLGGILALKGETWFFKMSGPDQLVASQREGFRAFLSNVRVTSGALLGAQTGASTNAPTPPPIEAPSSAPFTYTLPPNWQEKPLSPMRLASFKVTAPNGKEADVSVVSLPGMAGGDLANVNRWRGQVKLGPMDEDTLARSAEHIKTNNHDYLLVDLVSDTPLGEQNEKQRILAAILDENDRSWFIKMTGEDQAVASQKGAFRDFIRSLTIP